MLISILRIRFCLLFRVSDLKKIVHWRVCRWFSPLRFANSHSSSAVLVSRGDQTTKPPNANASRMEQAKKKLLWITENSFSTFMHASHSVELNYGRHRFRLLYVHKHIMKLFALLSCSIVAEMYMCVDVAVAVWRHRVQWPYNRRRNKLIYFACNKKSSRNISREWMVLYIFCCIEKWHQPSHRRRLRLPNSTQNNKTLSLRAIYCVRIRNNWCGSS